MARMTRPSAKVELAALHCLVLALNGQGRYEEAEAVARGAAPCREGGRHGPGLWLGPQPQRPGSP
ncbi:hypothetical protein [Streptomyces sp. NPDC056682]|uniref:hypothetical protein n=1 Tax=Streptomyces sp. NPDC056682 TaxID=3345909 RepID=UPI003681D9EC